MDYLKSGADQFNNYESVHLHGLIQYGHVIYLVVTINEHDDPRLLLLHRIQRVTITQRPIQSIPDFDLERFIENGGLGFGGISSTIQLVAKFKNKVGYYLIDTPLSFDQTIQRKDENVILLTATLQETARLHWWLMQFGPDIEIMAPSELRNYISDRHRQSVVKPEAE